MESITQTFTPKYPKILGSLLHNNQVLKIFAALSLFVSLGLIILIFSLTSKPPLIFSFSEKALVLESSPLPKPEIEIEQAIRSYLNSRYEWSPEGVKEALERAKYFIAPQSLKAYQTATANLIQFSTQRLVSQKIYPGSIQVSLEQKTALVQGERITSIHGLKAVGNLKIELSFESGPRSPENPWGIFITREKEEAQQ